jgi:ArsR family transcriptional regulator
MTVSFPASTLSERQFELIARALADPRRMALLESIGSQRVYSCQRLCQEFPVSKGTISHHMKELVRAGLVLSHREGQYRKYEVRREVLAAYTAELMRRVARVSGS